MVMSQNFPSFYDGILAGAADFDQEAQALTDTYSIEQFLNAYSSNPSLPSLSFVNQPAPQPPAPIVYSAFPAADQGLLEAAILQTCDALDGVADGVVDNLPACKAKFDPATATYTSGGVTHKLQCIGAKDASCLSPAQIQAVKKINQGPRSRGREVAAPAGDIGEDSATNIAQGYAWDGGWMTTAGVPARKLGSPTAVPGDLPLRVGQFGYAFIAPPQPTYYTLGFNFDTDLGLLNPSTPIVSYSVSTDIKRFVDYGHKIIWYHGLSDPGPPVSAVTKYYHEMARRFGSLEKAQHFSRLYRVPNMGHCSGGAATDKFDLLTPLADWVENGNAPQSIQATGVNFTPAVYQVSFVAGPTSRTRPLCPYPQQVRFIGSVSSVAGTPVATNQADLADPSKYQCISAQTDHRE